MRRVLAALLTLAALTSSAVVIGAGGLDRACPGSTVYTRFVAHEACLARGGDNCSLPYGR